MKKEELGKSIVDALKLITKLKDKDLSEESKKPLISYLYTPDKNLTIYLKKLKKEIEISKLPQKERPSNHHTQIGQLLEQIAYLCFSNLEGLSSIKSFQSPGPQYDLLVTGDDLSWKALCELLYIHSKSRDILVEVKATKKKVDDQIFSRLCSLLDINLFKNTGLGVFFTLNGATGFPQKKDGTRQRKIGDSRLRQLMFSIGRGKSIVVFDQDDIYQLDKSGSLIRILIKKIRDIEQLTGKYIPPVIEEPVEKDLPAHLQNL